MDKAELSKEQRTLRTMRKTLGSVVRDHALDRFQSCERSIRIGPIERDDLFAIAVAAGRLAC